MMTRSTHVVRSWRTERDAEVTTSLCFCYVVARLATSPLAFELGHNTNSRRLVWLPAGPGERALLCARRLTILRCSPCSIRCPPLFHIPLALLPLLSRVPLSPSRLALFLSLWIILFVALSVRHARTRSPLSFHPTADLPVFFSASLRDSLLSSTRLPSLYVGSLNLVVSPPIESTNYPRRLQPASSRSSRIKR